MAKPASKRGENTPPAKLVGDGPELWGSSSAERLRRMFARAGISDVSGWDGSHVSSGACLVVSAGHVYAQILLNDLSKRPNVVLTLDGSPVAGNVPSDRANDLVADIAEGTLKRVADLSACAPEELSYSYDTALRKRETPYVMELSKNNIRAIEQRTFDGSYKGVTDFVTRHVWPKPALAVTRWCASRGITPNAVTSVSLVFVLAAMWLFWNGHFAFGLVAAWLMTFLDTVDGKLARVTVTSTKFGNVFDHGIDLIHPPFWYWAWAVGVWSTTDAPQCLTVALWVTVIGYVGQRVQEGIFIARFKMEMHIWRKFDSFYRLIVARRNPNLVLLSVFALVGSPGEGLIAVAIWTSVSMVVHSVQIVQALRYDKPLQSWLDH